MFELDATDNEDEQDMISDLVKQIRSNIERAERQACIDMIKRHLGDAVYDDWPMSF